ncbi:MAG TPA: TcpE family conjugal transfer membrane protein [Trebonia sp.]
MDLPTYTNIWRIEKRLYKLYDFRLPMPLPINWIAVFAGITIPYIVLLIAIGLPFNHTLVWLYVLPPGVLTWLTTRPVIENKRLPELVESQMRYLAEPRTWVRLTPLSEKDQVALNARVWHGRPAKHPAPARPAPVNRLALPSAEPGREVGALRPGPVIKPTSVFRPEAAAAAEPIIEGRPTRQRRSSGTPQRVRAQERARGQVRARGQGQQRSRIPVLGQELGQGPARPAPSLPPTRQFPPPGIVVAPEPSDPPVRAMPDVAAPAAAAIVPAPVLPAGPESAPVVMPWPGRVTPSAPPDQAASAPTDRSTAFAPSEPPAEEDPPAPAAKSAPPATPQPVRLRARLDAHGGPRLEVSHDGPRGRGSAKTPLAPPVQSEASAPSVEQEPTGQQEPATPVGPATPVRAATVWPARPSRQVPPATRDTASARAEDGPVLFVSAAPAWPTSAPAPEPSAPDHRAQAPAALVPDAPPAVASAAVVPEVDEQEAPQPVAPEPPAPAPQPAGPPAEAFVATPAEQPAKPSAEPPAEPVRQASVRFEVFEAPAPAPQPAEPPAEVRDATPAEPPAEPVRQAPARFEVFEAPVAPAPAPMRAEPPVEVSIAAPARQPAAMPSVEPPVRHAAARVEVVEVPPVTAPAPQSAGPAPAPAAAQVSEAKKASLPSIERALSRPARDMTSSWGGKVRITTGNGAGHGPGARDQEAQDRNRARLPIPQPKRLLVLGCTSGAGQSVTTLMTASMLASLREHPVAAVDLHDGTLARYRAPAAWLEELMAGKAPQTIRSARPDGLHPTPKPSPARLDVVASHEPLSDGDEIKLAVQLNRHYPLTLLDPGAAALTRLLKVADQLVVVVPANVDAAGALADTRDWLDNNGHADLAMQSVTVINGVSRRSLPDVERAESIARGRSRAIVRVPWDDMLPVAAANPSTLRPQTRVAYTALAGVLAAGLAVAPVRKKPNDR